jgi:tetratricopeptide (TPR) repeat protein
MSAGAILLFDSGLLVIFILLPLSLSLGMKCFLLFSILTGLSFQGVSQTKNDSLITLLKKEIDQKQVYVQQKLKRIEKLKTQLVRINQLRLDQQFDLYNELYHEYKTFIYDSAFKYAQKLIKTSYKLNDKSRIDYARVKLGFILVSSGMFKETFDSLNVVDVQNLLDSSHVDYYRLFSRAYSDLDIYDKDDYYRKFYDSLNRNYLDSALTWSKPGSYYYYYLTAVKDLQVKNYQGTINAVNELLATHALTNPQLAVNYNDLGNAYRALGDVEHTITYTIMSSLSDIRAATKETAAMHNLAKLLYEQGDIENAYVFIKQALDDAEFYGARQRKVQISSILPVIAAARLTSVEGQRKIWLIYSSGLTVLILVIVVFSVIIFKQLKKLKAAEAVITLANVNLQETNQKLVEADKIKEEYIGYYFSNNSEYIDKIESLKKSIDQKLQGKKVEDIRYLVNTINPGREREELYFNFDKIFLKLFPDFVILFNSYFNPEDRIILKENQLLNTELRIFALIRLGIHDAEKIARILGYSVNTIYAYKNRVKSKSLVPNEQFERKIMEINSVSVSKP